MVVVPDFTIVANPNNFTITAGTGATSTITISSVNGFTGTVTLNDTVSPSTGGLTATLNPTMVTGGSGTSTLTISTTASTTPGTYTITVNGYSGTLTHSTTVTVVVSPKQVAQEPTFSSVQYQHAFKVSRNNGQLTFNINVFNPYNSTTLYVKVQVTAVSDTGTITRIAYSAVTTVGPLATVSANVVMQFQPTDAGHRYTVTFTIHWGTDPSSLNNTSSNVVIDTLKLKN
jgi:hypothetical protein